MSRSDPYGVSKDLDPRRFMDENARRLEKGDRVVPVGEQERYRGERPIDIERPKEPEHPSHHSKHSTKPPRQEHRARSETPQPEPEQKQPEPAPEPSQAEAAREATTALPPEPDPPQSAADREPDVDLPDQSEGGNKAPEGFWQGVINEAAELGLGIQNQKENALGTLDKALGEWVQNDGGMLATLGATAISTGAHYMMDDLVDAIANPLSVVKNVQEEGLSLGSVMAIAGVIPGVGAHASKLAKKAAKKIKGMPLTKSLRNWASPFVGHYDDLAAQGKLTTKGPGARTINPKKAVDRKAGRRVMGESARDAAVRIGLEDGEYHWAHLVARQLDADVNIPSNFVAAPAAANYAMKDLEDALAAVAKNRKVKVEVDAVAHVYKDTHVGVGIDYKVTIDGNDLDPFPFDFNHPEDMREFIALLLKG